jgi:UPF0716 family protein affecting phage T7 exclusion
MRSSPFFIYILPVVLVLVVGALGSTRRIGFWAALILAILLTPIGGGIVALISGPRRFGNDRARSGA